MTRSRYASADFAGVADRLVADSPERLLHADVLNSAPRESHAFSIERRHLVRPVDLPTRTLSMTIGGLEPGQSTRMHRHNYETVIYIVSGAGISIIGDREIPWKAGDALYVPVWAWHQHINGSDADPALYVACENAPLLQNLGVALRQERS
jgi:gentisate 1,2-dioxygenase